MLMVYSYAQKFLGCSFVIFFIYLWVSVPDSMCPICKIGCILENLAKKAPNLFQNSSSAFYILVTNIYNSRNVTQTNNLFSKDITQVNFFHVSPVFIYFVHVLVLFSSSCLFVCYCVENVGNEHFWNIWKNKNKKQNKVVSYPITFLPPYPSNPTYFNTCICVNY